VLDQVSRRSGLGRRQVIQIVVVVVIGYGPACTRAAVIA
jgi:hypothetical protein